MHTYYTTMLWSVDSCQNRVSADQYHLTISRAQVLTHWEVIHWRVTSFQMIPGASLIFLNSYEICPGFLLAWNSPNCLSRFLLSIVIRWNSGWYFCSTIKILISNWPRMRKFSQLLQAEKIVAFDFAHHDHALVMLFVHFFMLWLVKIWQVSKCGKFMQHLESCLFWQLKLTEFCVNLWRF